MDNSIILGYVLKVLVRLKFREQHISDILDELYYLFDTMTLEEAEQYCQKNICTYIF